MKGYLCWTSISEASTTGVSFAEFRPSVPRGRELLGVYIAKKWKLTMRRFAALALTAMLATGILAGCSSSKKSADTTAAAATAGTTAAASISDTTAVAGELSAAPAATGTPVNVEAVETSASMYVFKIDTSTVKAGKVTFTLKNTGTKVHELIILKTDTGADKLIVGADDKVSEDASVGEISETDAGKTVAKTFDLAAGNYVLVCNLAKHYGYGMRTAFTVTA